MENCRTLLTPKEITPSKGSFERQTAFEVFKAQSLVPEITQRAREDLVVNAAAVVLVNTGLLWMLVMRG